MLNEIGNGKFIYSSNYARGIKLFTKILQTIIKSKKDSEAFEEKIRLLYVAMTRAKEKLIMTATASKKSLDEKVVSAIDYFLMITELDTNISNMDSTKQMVINTNFFTIYRQKYVKT